MTEQEYKKIRVYVQTTMADGFDPQHSFDHVERVRLNALKIVNLLKIKDIDLNLLQAACLLHDIPVYKFRHTPAIKHWLENYAVIKFLPKILNELVSSETERKILLDAIRKHTFTIPYKRLNRQGDLILKIMQDADSLDYFSYEREKSLLSNRHRYFSYFIASMLSEKFLNYGRNNLGQYLNFPELSEYKWFELK